MTKSSPQSCGGALVIAEDLKTAATALGEKGADGLLTRAYDVQVNAEWRQEMRRRLEYLQRL